MERGSVNEIIQRLFHLSEEEPTSFVKWTPCSYDSSRPTTQWGHKVYTYNKVWACLKSAILGKGEGIFKVGSNTSSSIFLNIAKKKFSVSNINLWKEMVLNLCKEIKPKVVDPLLSKRYVRDKPQKTESTGSNINHVNKLIDIPSPEITFGFYFSCPNFEEDNTFTALTRNLKKYVDLSTDCSIQAIFGPPGSGKTTTIHVAAKRMEDVALFSCFSLTKPYMNDFINDLEHNIEEEKRWDHFVKILKQVINSIIQKLKGRKEKFCILFIDEFQTLWNLGKDFCQKLAMYCFNQVENNICVVFAGTCCYVSSNFVPLGSGVKCDYHSPNGSLTKEWVVEKILPNDNRFKSSELEWFIEDLRHNRRMIVNFCLKLKDEVQKDVMIDKKVLEQFWTSVFDDWSNGVEAAMKNEDISDLPILVAKLLYPTPDQQCGGEFMEFDSSEQKLVQYGKHGAVSMKVVQANGNILVLKPKGCMKRFLVRMASRILTSKNLYEVKNFQTCAASVESIKGHLAERILSAELTMFRLDSVFSAVGTKVKMDLLQPLELVGSDFNYYEKLHEKLGEAKNNSVFCVKEFGSQGRDIDVLCPVLFNQEYWNLCFEVKCLENTPNLLVKLCKAFFEKMGVYYEKYPKTIFVFLSIDEFNCDEEINILLEKKPRFAVLAGEDLQGIFSDLRNSMINNPDITPDKPQHKRTFSYEGAVPCDGFHSSSSKNGVSLDEPMNKKARTLLGNNSSSSSSKSK